MPENRVAKCAHCGESIFLNPSGPWWFSLESNPYLMYQPQCAANSDWFHVPGNVPTTTSDEAMSKIINLSRMIMDLAATSVHNVAEVAKLVHEVSGWHELQRRHDALRGAIAKTADELHECFLASKERNTLPEYYRDHLRALLEADTATTTTDPPLDGYPCD